MIVIREKKIAELIELMKKETQSERAVRKAQKELIAYWNSIPRWQFWKRPSKKKQREIIFGSSFNLEYIDCQLKNLIKEKQK